MSEQKEQLGNQLQLQQEKISQIESHKESSINELMSLNTKLLAERDSFKKEIKNVSKIKLELETVIESAIEDLKRTLNLAEKESQVNMTFYLLIYLNSVKPFHEGHVLPMARLQIRRYDA